jgi:hypothetical protein
MRDWKCSLVLPLLILLISLTSYGERRVDPSAASGGSPAVAVNQDGVVLVVWVRDTNPDNNAGTIYYSVLKDGNWSAPKDARITRIQAWTPQLDIDSEGNFHIAYPDGNSRWNREIYHCVYNPDSGWSPEKMIWNSPENSGWAKLDVHDDIVSIAWFHEHTDPYQGEDIVMQSKGIHEQSWPTLYERISYTANDTTSHPGFKGKDGRIYICYQEGIGNQLPWRIFYKEADLGSNWINIPPVKLEENGYYPELEVDDFGNVHVVWSNKAGNFIYKQRVNGSWKANEVISSKYAPLQFGDIRYKNNILVATWAQSDAEGISIHYSKKLPGRKWEAPVKVAQGSNAYACKVWLDDDGYAHFVWHDNWRVYYDKVVVPIEEPFLQLSDRSLSFVVEGRNPDPEIVVLKNLGEKYLDYTVKVNQSWLSVTPSSGKLNKGEMQELQISIDAFDLDEGTYTGTIEISSPQAINSPQQISVDLEVLAPPIYPPLNFKGEVLENMALFYREYMHHLTWETNPQNRNISQYRLYEIEGVNYILIAEIPSSTTEYTRRHIKKGKAYNYELWAVDDKGRTGNQPAQLNISSSTLKN